MNYKHGLSGTADYNIWMSLKSRCYNKKFVLYKYYGGQGITICKRWLDKKKGLQNFIEDMGIKPEPKNLYYIGRINHDGNYTPKNCIWTNTTELQRNQSNTKLNAQAVKEMRDLVDNGMSFKELRKLYTDYKYATLLAAIIKRRTWKNI